MPQERIATWMDAACLHFIERCAVPITHACGSPTRIVGTGAIFSVAGRSALVSACHVVDALEGGVGSDNVFIPLPQHARKLGQRAHRDLGEFQVLSQPSTDLGAVRTVRSEAPAVDLGAFVLESNDVVEKLTGSYQSLELGSLLPPDQKVEFYCIGGYPEGAVLEQGLRFTHSKVHALQKIPEASWASAPDPTINLLLSVPPNILNQAGEPIRRPTLSGMSGALVWAVPQPTSTHRPFGFHSTTLLLPGSKPLLETISKADAE